VRGANDYLDPARDHLLDYHASKIGAQPRSHIVVSVSYRVFINQIESDAADFGFVDDVLYHRHS